MMNHMSEREREREGDIEKLDPKGASCEFLLFCWSPQGTSLGDASHLTFAGMTSDGDYLLIIHDQLYIM